MSDPIDFETINAAKAVHAQDVIDAMAGIRTLLTSQPDLWFGGLPPVMVQLDHLLIAQTDRIREQFGLTPPTT